MSSSQTETTTITTQPTICCRINTNPDIEPFKIFKHTDHSIKDCFNALDVNSDNMTDSQKTQLCCRECQWMCWPLFLVYDVVSCPIRCSCHIKDKYSCGKSQPQTQSK